MRYVTAALAMASGFIVLAGYLYPIAALTGLRIMLTDWAIVIGAWAVIVGIINLALVHLEKIRRREKNSIYGLLLILSLAITFGFGIVFRPDHQFMQTAMDAVVVPVEGSLMAILAVTLVYASIRLFRRRADMMTVIFLVVAILFLIAIVLSSLLGPAFGELVAEPVLHFLSMFSSGGARGLLIGIALGTLLTSLRVLLGIDRPYGGN